MRHLQALILSLCLLSPMAQAGAPLREQADLYGVVLDLKPVPTDKKAAEESSTRWNVTVKLDSSGSASDASSSEQTRDMLPNIVKVENVIDDNPVYNIPLHRGARVLLSMETDPATGLREFTLVNRDRTPALIVLGTVTLTALLLIGGSEVARHALLVALMMLGAYKMLFPLIVSGQGGAVSLTVLCVAFPVLAGLIHSGREANSHLISREQAIITLGVLGGTSLLAVILWLMGLITPLSGFTSDDLASLWQRSACMDYWLLYRASVLIGFQGLLFYLCRLLARQRQSEMPPSFRERFSIVMQRGRGLLGPLISSLGLLCLGLFLPILLQMEGTSTAQFINLESTASLFVFAFAGGLTLILSLPLTAFLSAWLPEASSGKQQRPIS